MQIFKTEAEDAESAKAKLSAELGIPPTDLHFVETKKNSHAFQAITFHPLIETEISKDKMSVWLKRIKPHMGNDVPKLTTDFVLEHLKKRGVVFGIKIDVITEQLFKFVSSAAQEAKLVNILIASGEPPVAAQAGRPQWVLDLKVFSKGKPVYCRKNEIVAKASLATKGRPGTNVFEEPIPFAIEDSFRLPTGKGIRVEARENETVYLTDMAGELQLDQGIRLRLENRVIDKNDGFVAAVQIGEASFTGKKFIPQDLIEIAEANGIRFGILPAKEIQAQMDKTSKWPAEITVAKGKEPVDGRAGKVDFVYQRAVGTREVDKEKAKLGFVFPGETIAVIPFPSLPQDGMTVFGESLRGRTYNEQPIYPGKNVTRERRENQDFLIANNYGRVKIEDDRVHVENALNISADKMSVSIDLFPQQPMSFKHMQDLFREADVLFGYSKEVLEPVLERVHLAGKREPELVVAIGQPVKAGKNAKLRYYFNPEDFKEKGIFSKSKTKTILAAPGDLILEKILPVEPLEGFNVYRERIEVPASMNPIDVDVKVEGDIDETEVGQELNDKDPPRLQYRAATFGTVGWANRQLKLKSVVEVDAAETTYRMRIAGLSDFGTPITYEMIEKFVLEDGVKVELQKNDIIKFLKQPRPEDGDLNWIEVAKSIPSVNGEDSKIDYYIEYNGEPVDPFLENKEVTPPKVLDFVRPKDILAQKKPAGNGVDGKTVFGRRIVAERGVDLPWQIGFGISRSKDGNQLIVDSKFPGYVEIEDRRLVLKTPIDISSDRMLAKMTLYPSRNPRFQLREEKVFEMIQAKGIQAGIRAEDIRNAIQECLSSGEPIEVEAAKGVPPKVGREAQYRFAFEVEAGSKAVREDGSIDYKAESVYHMVKNGQLLMVKQEATRGDDGFNVLGERLPGQLGGDHVVSPGEGVKIMGPDFVSTRDGIVEFSGKTIRVIEGLYIPGNVDFSTGNISSGPAKVMIRGSILPGFQVKSESEVIVEKQAEACDVYAGSNAIIRGGVIGKDKGRIYAMKNIEALYANSGSTLEAKCDILVKNEILDCNVRAGGKIICEGTLSGGEVWVFDTLQTKTLGAAGSEKATKIFLGVNYLDLQAATKRIEEEGIPQKEKEYSEELSQVEKRLAEIYAEIPEASKRNHEEARQLQEEYKEWMTKKKEIQRNQELVQRQRQVLMDTVQRNKGVQVIVKEMIHPGVSFIYKDVVWELKEPLRGVVIQWNEGSSNFISRRI